MSDPEDRTPDDEGVDDEELAELADELSDVLRELRDELRASREGEPVEEPPIPEGGGGAGSSGGGGGELPDIPFDLPSATDVLAFTDEKLIPAAITVLEVNIRALELLQKGIRWARPDKAGENAERVRSRAESISRSSLQRLDTVLADLQEAAGEGALPDDAQARDVITEARQLRDEIDAALRERAEARGEDLDDEAPDDAEDDEDEGHRRTSPWDDQPEVDVDVESELESIKAELGKDEDDEDDEPGAEGGDDRPDDEATAGDEPAGGDSDEESGEDSPDTDGFELDGDGPAGEDDADEAAGADADGDDSPDADDGDDERDDA